MSAAYSAFAKVGHGIPATSPSRIPRPVVLLALVVALVLATLPLVGPIRDRASDARIVGMPTWPYRGEVS